MRFYLISFHVAAAADFAAVGAAAAAVAVQIFAKCKVTQSICANKTIGGKSNGFSNAPNIKYACECECFANIYLNILNIYREQQTVPKQL